MRASGSQRDRSGLDLLRAALRDDLDFHGAKGSHATHSWHPFPARFPPQLPQFFIEHLSARKDTVFDPMFGSGTTLVEAARLGRRAVGCDIDPLARMMTAAKLVPLEAAKTLEAGYAVIHAARRTLGYGRDQLERELSQRFDEKTRAFVNYWFLPQHQLELLALLREIALVRQEGMQQFFKVVFSSTIIAKSGGVSLARDLAHTRPHRVAEKKPNSAFVEFAKRLKASLASVAGDSAIGQSADIRAARADKTGLPPASVDLIVTSPPYANNAIDYMRAHKFSLVWFGWTIDTLARIRAQYLGHEAVAGVRFDPLPRQCEGTLATLAERDAKKAAVLRRYFGEMSAVISEMWRVLKKGKPAVIVVGSSNLRGIDVETQKGLAAIGQSVGFAVAGIGTRRLDRDRRMMPARWGRERHSQIEERMHEEYVIGLIKQ